MAQGIFMKYAGLVGFLAAAGLLMHLCQQQKNARDLERLYSQIVALCLDRADPAQETVADKLRACVRNNTQHLIDAEFYTHWKNKTEMAQAMLDYMTGRRTTKMPFECSTRSGLLIGLLRAREIIARDVVITSTTDGFPDHVLVEALNSTTRKWEVEDPTYNLYYVGRDGRRLSAEEIVTADVDDVTPCRDPHSCGWDRVTAENLPVAGVRSYWEAMAVKDEDGDWQLQYDAKGFNPYGYSLSPSTTLSYCDLREKFCKNPPRPTTFY